MRECQRAEKVQKRDAWMMEIADEKREREILRLLIGVQRRRVCVDDTFCERVMRDGWSTGKEIMAQTADIEERDFG